MKSFALTILVSSFFLISSGKAGAEGSQDYYKNEQWTVAKYPTVCVMSASTDAYSFHLATSRKNPGINVSIYNQAWKSLRNGEEVKLELNFLAGKDLDTGWGKVSGTAFVDDDGSGDRGIRFNLDKSDFLADFRKSTTIGFLRGDVIVIAMSLTGGADAANQLEACTKQVESENPGDPFAY